MNKVYIAGGCDYNDSLMHYGVVGMKWGVRKANYRSNQIERFKNRASKYTDKAIEKKYEADAYHLKNDMNRSKRVAKKIKTFSNKSEFYKQLANDTGLTKYAKKASKYAYKAEKKKVKLNKVSRREAYSKKANRLATKADKYLSKVAKMEYKINRNKLYIETVAKKASTITPEQKQKGMAFVDEFLKEYEKKKG